MSQQPPYDELMRTTLDTIQALRGWLYDNPEHPSRRARLRAGLSLYEAETMMELGHGQLSKPRVSHDTDITSQGAITCFLCGKTCLSPHDAEHRYCASCHRFHGAPLVPREKACPQCGNGHTRTLLFFADTCEALCPCGCLYHLPTMEVRA